MLETQSHFLACTLELLTSPSGELEQSYFYLLTHQLVMSIRMKGCVFLVFGHCSITHSLYVSLPNSLEERDLKTLRAILASSLSRLDVRQLKTTNFARTDNCHVFISCCLYKDRYSTLVYNVVYSTHLIQFPTGISPTKHIPPTDGIPPAFSGMYISIITSVKLKLNDQTLYPGFLVHAI